jgi:UPF0755 protein
MSKKIVFIINILIVVTVIFFMTDVLGMFGNGKNITIEITQNDSLTSISKRLEDEKIILNKDLFKLFYKINSRNKIITPSLLVVNSKMPYKEIVRLINQPNSTSIKITIPEGFEVREIAKRLVDNELIRSEQDFFVALSKYKLTLPDGTVIKGDKYNLSGYLYPDTYFFYKKTTETDIIDKMTQNFIKNWKPEYTDQAKKMGYSIDEMVTLASIVEREARNKEDFPLVSSVFHNRLKVKQLLQSCATVQYILKERKPILSVADTKIKSPYNTYQNAGLPPSPISSPGNLALKSALYPDDTDYLYFFVDKNGENHYSKTYNEHNAKIKEFGL